MSGLSCLNLILHFIMIMYMVYLVARNRELNSDYNALWTSQHPKKDITIPKKEEKIPLARTYEEKIPDALTGAHDG